jgi:hypothetical protein
MPIKTRWTINPKKWFGGKSKTKHKQEPSISPSIRAPFTPATTTRTVPSTSTFSQFITGKNKNNATPMAISNTVQRNNTMVTQVQLPAFVIRRERTLNRQNTFHPTPTEPTIRKTIRIDGELSINTTPWNIPTFTTSIYGNFRRNSSIKQIEMSMSNMSHRCVIDYPRQSTNRMEESLLASRSSSVLSIMNDDHSSSSGVFTDERQRTNSKDTLSILEVISVESISDSDTSLNHSQKRPIIHHYRRPVSVFGTINDKPEQRQLSHRSHSAEGLLKENPTKSRQTSVAIIKKVDKGFPTSCLPPATLGKAGIVRIANDTYRLTTNKIDQPRKNSINSFVPSLTYEDLLRPAKNEESYAALPRTTSTEQLTNVNLHNNLRMIVDNCFRPMISSIEKSRLTKTHPRFKRSQGGQIPLNIENITDKLLSSIDYSIYTRYQRGN